LVGGFSHLKSFPCNNFYGLETQVIGKVVMSLVTTGLGYNLAMTNSDIFMKLGILAVLSIDLFE
jgi:hypothetical protein